MPTDVGQDIGARIAKRARATIASELRTASGCEVFFACPVDGDGVIVQARVCCRGNEGAVPALIESVRPGEVVVHNHPSGNLRPSEADLELAAMFGKNGHGVYIIDNSATQVYVVVEPFVAEETALLQRAELAGFLGPGSRLAEALPGYEERQQQVEMTGAVAESFNNDGIAIVEAPTGVGKTMAYLLPAVLWSKRNRERVVVSTRTINLQEQVIQKDIPLLAKALGEDVRAVLVKGRGNYVCRRNFERAFSEAGLFDDEETQDTLRTLAEWVRGTGDGSLSDLSFVPGRDIWDRVCSSADTCTGLQCPSASTCFVTRARREIAKADIIVTNHHMLFSDLAIKRDLGSFSALAVLPAYRRVIFDEAHNVEDSATEYFGMNVTRNGAMYALGRLLRLERGRERGLLPYVKLKMMQMREGLSSHVHDQLLDLIDNDLLPAVAAARGSLDTAFEVLRGLVAERCGQIGREIKWRLTPKALELPELRELHQVYVMPAVEEVLRCAKLAASLRDELRDIGPSPGEKEPPFLTEAAVLRGSAETLQRLAAGLAEGTSAELAENTVRWVEIDARRKHIVRIARCPLEVARELAEWVYPNLRTTVMTSATLAVQQRFDYLEGRLGLNLVTGREVTTMALDSPFDFEEQALLCIPTDIAAPDDKDFLEQSTEHIRKVLSITRGHAFVLFTSFYALDYAHTRLRDRLREEGIVALRQGEANRSLLLDRFRKDASSVLFGTDSFWEGVDVAGDALQCVIVPKLPFRVPTEPVLEARAEAIDAAGANSFMSFTVPQAVIKFRQGFGRLIRRRTDRGAIVVLDRRVVARHYGRMFLRSLPGVKTVKGPERGVYEALARFFGQRKELEHGHGHPG